MPKNLTSSEYKLVLWSFDYIRHNLEVTTDRLPDVLVKFWTIPDFLTHLQYENKGVQMIVFMYIVRMNKWPEEKMEEFIKSFYFGQLFYCFQVILATISYCRQNHIPIVPFPIFDLEKYSLPALCKEGELLKYYGLITGNKFV
ncbi:MAG: hypothetical protein K2L23_06675 [Odoribacter sp.]|nr:hypothetical protein [Odoribacter sp.]